MKHPIPRCLFLCCLLPAWGLSQNPPADPFVVPKANPAGVAQEADASGPKTIMLTYETFSLPKAVASALMMKHRAKDELHAAVLKEYEANKAVLEHLILIRTKSGQRAKVEGIDEFLYATDFEPAQIPQTLHLGPMGADQARERKEKAKQPPTTSAVGTPPGTQGQTCAEAGEAIVAEPSVPLNDGLGLMTNATANTFTTRNVGQTIEVELTLGEDGKTMDIIIGPEFVSWIGETQIFQGVALPVFQARKINISCTIQSGHAMFIGTQSKPLKTGATNTNANDSLWLTFLTPKVVAVAIPPKPIANPAGQVQVRWENISLPKAEAFKLLTAALPDPELHQRLQAMVLAGTARLDSVLSVMAKSGVRCKVEQVEEFLYGSDFDPSQIAQNLTITDPSLLRQLSQDGGAMGKRHSALTAGNLGFGNITGTCTTTFASRNLGETMEFELWQGEDGSTIDVTFAPAIAHLVGELRYGDIKQPVFETQKLSTSGTLTKGQPYCFGSMSKPWQSGVVGGNSEDRVWLQFVTAEDP